MAVKGITVISCGVRYENDTPMFTKTSVKVRSKIKEGKTTKEHDVTYTLDLEGVPVAEVLEKASAAYRIDLAKIREKGDEAVAALNEATIHALAIAGMTAGDGVDPLVKALVSMGMPKEQAEEICGDPEKRAKMAKRVLTIE